MKRISIICAIVLIFALSAPFSAFAEPTAAPSASSKPDETPAPSASSVPDQTPAPSASSEPDIPDDPEPAVSADLQLDPALKISDNDPKTLNAGYMPNVHAANAFSIRVPFKGNEGIEGAVNVAPEISAEDGAFFPSNVIVTLNNISSGQSEYAEFKIQTRASVYDGVYPITFAASYNDGTGAVVSKTYTLYVSIYGHPYVEPTPEPEPTPAPVEGPVSLPKLMVTGYTASPERAVAGEDIAISFTVKNMSKRKAVNIEITVSSESGTLLPKGGTNSAFIDVLKYNEEHTLSFDFSVKPDADPSPTVISIDIKYEDTEVNSGSASSVISVPVDQPIRTRLSDAKSQGGTFDNPFSVSLTLVNMGKSTLYNVAAELSGENFDQATSYYGGTLPPGEQKQIELMANALDMTGEQFQTFPGFVTVTFEDVNGKVYTEEKPFSVDMEQYIDDMFNPGFMPEDIPEEPASPGIPWWVWAIAGAAVVAALIVILTIRGRRRKKAIEDELL